MVSCSPRDIPMNLHPLTHWGRVTHICVGKLTIIASDNGLSPGRRQAIIWTNTGILLIGPLGTNFSEILIEIETFSFKKMHLKRSSGKWRPSCLGLNVLNTPWERLGGRQPGGFFIVGWLVFSQWRRSVFFRAAIFINNCKDSYIYQISTKGAIMIILCYHLNVPREKNYCHPRK